MVLVGHSGWVSQTLVRPVSESAPLAAESSALAAASMSSEPESSEIAEETTSMIAVRT